MIFSFTLRILNYLKNQKTGGTTCLASSFTAIDQVTSGLTQGVGWAKTNRLIFY